MTDDWKQHLNALHADLVRRDDPVAWVMEADAVEASRRYPRIALRGPVFGVAKFDTAQEGARWQVVLPLMDGMPQQSRDGLNSHLWFTAKDRTEVADERKELLAAVAVLEREPVDEVQACGVRYRVVRGDEFARSGEFGLEPPRPTDPEPTEPAWEGRDATRMDVGFTLDPGSDDGPMAGALRLGLRDFAYTDSRFPADARKESRDAVTTHPEIVRLPVGFAVVERDSSGWCPRSDPKATPHEARRRLYKAMTYDWPMLKQWPEEKVALYARVAEEFRSAGRADEARVDGRHFRICRIERIVRMGPDGPEPPRPSDQDEYEPMKMHPTMLPDGTIIYDDSPEEEDDAGARADAD